MKLVLIALKLKAVEIRSLLCNSSKGIPYSYRYISLKKVKTGYVRPEWIAELEKISHRPYTDGLAEGRPDETAQNYG